MNTLISQLTTEFVLSPFVSQKLGEIMTLVNIKKNEVFVEKGRKNSMEYFLLNGVCRSHLENANGDEVTLSFFTANTPISPNLIRTKSDKSVLNIQALTNVKITTFSTVDLMALMQSHREVEVWANATLQTELMRKVSKEINQISLNAKERLIDFRSQYSTLENIIPHSYIASYLGITNVTLSRLRKELST